MNLQGGVYPRKLRLTPSEQLTVLRDGPPLEWFGGWLFTGELKVTPDLLTWHERYELVHIYFDARRGRLVQEAVMFDDLERFRWAVGRTWDAHAAGRARCYGSGNQHLGVYYYVYPALPYTELERDENYRSPIGALRFQPRGRGLR